MEFKNWKIPIAIGSIIALILINGSYVLVFNDLNGIISYMWMHIGFIPIDIILVVLIIDGFISKKEKEAMHEKYDMLISSFYMEMGNELLSKLTASNLKSTDLAYFKDIKTWNITDFDIELKNLMDNHLKFDYNFKGEDRLIFLKDLKEFLIFNKKFLMNLLNNPYLFEKDHFSALLIAISHLSEELYYRSNLDKITENDFNHIIFDINRVYGNLVFEWIRYLRHTKKHHPYILDIALRTNPFDNDASIIIYD